MTDERNNHLALGSLRIAEALGEAVLATTEANEATDDKNRVALKLTTALGKFVGKYVPHLSWDNLASYVYNTDLEANFNHAKALVEAVRPLDNPALHQAMGKAVVNRFRSTIEDEHADMNGSECVDACMHAFEDWMAANK